jgi:hypothetical protein
MKAFIKSSPRSNHNIMLMITAALFLIAYFAGIKFDFTVFGYFALILASPVLVLFASDLKDMKRA